MARVPVLGATVGARVRACALLLGGIGFLGGFVGPMVLAPEANQGPLLGIFITGPLGALLGPLVGVASLAPRATPAMLPAAWGWLALVWAGAMVVYALAGGGPNLPVALALGLMAAVALVGAAFALGAVRAGAAPLRAALPPAAAALMLALSLVPPATHPAWAPPALAATPVPPLVWVFDSGFEPGPDGSLYALDARGWLVGELVVAGAALAGFLLLGRDSRRV